MRVAAVVALKPGLPGEYLTLRIGRGELREPDQLRGQSSQLFPGQVADHGLTGELLPPGLGQPVVEDHVGAVDEARDPEGEGAIAEPAVKDDGAVTDRTEGDEHGGCADHIVD